MKSLRSLFVVALLCGLCGVAAAADKSAANSSKAEWSMNATIIEACSCPMFCQCYFNSEPAGHKMAGMDDQHYCKFNNALMVNKGHYKGTKLDGAKFWVSGDLGGDFSQGKMDWGVLTFDPSVTPAQRDGIKEILGHVYPVQWNSFTVASDAPMEWKYGKDQAEARLDGGKTAEVVLKRFQGNTSEPVVIKNLKYWGVPRNDGFVLMPNEIEAYHAGDKPFEYKHSNGFMITFDINSNDVHKM